MNLIKTPQQLQEEMEQQQQQMQQKALLDQAGQLAGTPLMDPQKNPQLAEQMMGEEEAPTEPPVE